MRPIAFRWRALVSMVVAAFAVVVAAAAVPPSGKTSRPGEPAVKPTAPHTARSTAADIDLAKLHKGDAVEGFGALALYLDGRDAPVGARFVHRKSGFVVDLLRIESVPQAFTWVNSFPVSDQGEPHTQEHLLLGKGTKGRSFAGLDTMWLAGSSAFTEQLQTCYHFNTAAGADVFFDLFTAQLDALLHPNYSDEEIRREVCNFGVVEGETGSLRLEEKGSVYNEMVSSTANPYWKLFQSAGHLAYGTSHPLSYNAGGEPSGIRTMKPEDIRRFHDANYHLWNMGTIASFPSSVPFREALGRMDAILSRAEPGGVSRPQITEKDLPAPAPAAPGTIRISDYPHKNHDQPSPVLLTWPANRSLDADETLLADLFVNAVAGDPTTNLYKMFIDSKTRRIDIGAKSVFGSVGRHQGNPVQIGFTDVDAANLTEEKLTAVRQAITGEVGRIAAFADGSPDLAEFNARIASRLVQAERDLAKFVNSPPGFGGRNTGSGWMDSLFLLDRSGEFRRSLTFRPQLAFARGLLATKKNFWKGYLEKWKITGVVPFVTAARPSPDLLAREERERTARGEAEAARLAKSYAVTDVQEAVKRYRTAYDADSARIEEEAARVPPASFVKSPPMTLDDQLHFDVAKLAGGVPIVTSRFDSMTSASVGLALRLDPLAREQLRYVSLLPTLMTQVGVIENGKPVPFEDMSERLRKEVLSLDAGFSSNMRTDRVELLVHGAGLGEKEAVRAMEWMALVLLHPDWRTENLPRIRDVVDQALTSLRNTMQGPEEYWVTDPANAYRMQANLAYLSAESPFTAEYNALRLRWLFKEAPAEHAKTLEEFLTRLSDAAKGASRADLETVLRARSEANDTPVPAGMKAIVDRLRELPPPARAVANEALEDLDLSLIEIPDQSLATDWKDLCTAMRDDLLTPPAKALAGLDAVRKRLLSRGGARVFVVGSSVMEKALAPKIASLVGSLDASAAPGATLSPTLPKDPWIDARLRGRDTTAADPVYVGLFAPNMTGGVIMTSVPGTGFTDTGRDKQLDYLASRLYAGYGAHGIFLKTIGAGLAYSNGLRASVSSGRIGYYAERTPEIPQTVKFVIDTIKGSQRDSKLGSYAVAQVFGEFRSAQSYESRAEGMAADLADGQPSEQVRRFRESILALSREPNLADTLFARKDAVLGKILPGYNVKGAEVPGGVYFVIGPDKQLDAWEHYLKSAEGPQTRLFRLYPRDFWIP